MRDYLHDLAVSSGLSAEEDVNANIRSLEEWGVLNEEMYSLDDCVTYGFLFDSLSGLMEKDAERFFQDKGMGKHRKDTYVRKEEAQKLIEEAVKEINSQDFSPVLEYEYKQEINPDSRTYEAGDLIIEDGSYKIVTYADEDGYECSDAAFEDVFREFEISDTYEIDFSQAEVIPYGTSDTAYQNENHELLASKKNTFEAGGFKITYTLSGSGVDLHAVNNIKGFDIYADISISNVRPSFHWKYEEGDLKNCYFDLAMHTSQQLGAKTGKYGDYYLKFKDLDSSSFLSLLDSMIDPVSDEVDTSIPLCRIKTPIPNIPTADLCLDVLLKISVSGKIELLVSNDFELGFETKNGQIRYIHDHSCTADTIIEASGKTGMGLNVALEALACRLADVELDGGIQAKLKSTIYLYDDEGKVSAKNSPISYSALQEISKENPDVRICGDVSLHWVMDLVINTAKSKMNKLGFSKTLHLLDDDDQLFGNLHHIENGQFVRKCTRKDRVNVKEMDEVSSEKIVLDSYAEVLHKNETYQIIVKALPEGYEISDLLYSSRNDAIAIVNDGLIQAVSPGSVQIRVDTKDGKYSAYVNILVSTG
ncbi:MAG: hypothetical protein IKS51_03500 [Erysipelotrichaceae bacterium]|nr:hypothetical protein [Erysipelotrichaceae bacterium]